VKTSNMKGGAKMTAQNVLEEEKNKTTATACGTACGASDDAQTEETKQPVSCGTACGASDDEEKKEKQKSSACGTACGAGE
jgi:ACGX-repeat protein